MNPIPEGNRPVSDTTICAQPAEPDPNLALWLDADSIRSAFDGDSGDEAAFVNAADDATLNQIGRAVLNDDDLYDAYRNALRDAIQNTVLFGSPDPRNT